MARVELRKIFEAFPVGKTGFQLTLEYGSRRGPGFVAKNHDDAIEWLLHHQLGLEETYCLLDHADQEREG